MTGAARTAIALALAGAGSVALTLCGPLDSDGVRRREASSGRRDAARSGSAISALQEARLFDIWELTVSNAGRYRNPFDYREIELQARFTSPSDRQLAFFGFFDGDGEGGQDGDVWRLRFMPDELGPWSYSFGWSDGLTGGSGTFEVTESDLPGPLEVDTEHPWFLVDGRGQPFHWRGYDLHIIAPYTGSGSFRDDLPFIEQQSRSRVVERGYNVVMLDGLNGRRPTDDRNVWRESWWVDGRDTNRFDLSAWKDWERLLHLLKDNGVYALTFAGMVYQGQEYDLDEFQVFLRYWTARFAPFYNFFGWSPTWEWTDIWSPREVDRIMRFLYESDPWRRLLSVHDCSHSRFQGWLGFSMRQADSARTVLHTNSRFAGQRQGVCDGEGGIGEPFRDLPIVGSEDIWEAVNSFAKPRNAAEVRRAAWGLMLAGVMPLYSEWQPNPPPRGGEGEGEPEVRRMFDFFYGRTRYRSYEQLNELVSGEARQIASGIPGEEYVVYDEDGGSVELDLSGVPGSLSFSALWFDPAAGAESLGGTVRGGGARTLESPFEGDSVLFLTLSR